ncbi:NADPH-dependent FMN reductase [Halopseudomonas maritima]|uniref:NADPH-dependent FMN reductase n=1 Tax=Halopseudomonas maritima TaxID=2918528 RepID=UPI001EEA044F|nr:NAD(P)H-dependent oxidoreductase [Halopseudomonas maritima]UJJ32260.1 NAD(P)H-dependent oxidoreductase [Halopseudomonas maritima]
MPRILALSGSLRAGSYNTQLARLASTLAPPGTTVDVATLHGIPLYDADLEEHSGIPAAVEQLKQQILACDGLLLVTPEYNNGIPGVMKNGIDWLSRADRTAIFSDRPVCVIGATPGGWGTLSAQSAWLPTLRMLGTREYHGHKVLLSHAASVFSDGAPKDETLERTLAELLTGFSDYIVQQTR